MLRSGFLFVGGSMTPNRRFYRSLLLWSGGFCIFHKECFPLKSPRRNGQGSWWIMLWISFLSTLRFGDRYIEHTLYLFSKCTVTAAASKVVFRHRQVQWNLKIQSIQLTNFLLTNLNFQKNVSTYEEILSC